MEMTGRIMMKLKVMMVFWLLAAATAASATEFKLPPGEGLKSGERLVVMPAVPHEAGYIVPGDRVDMVVTLFTGAARGLTSVTVLQNVRVLAVRSKDGSAWLALALTPMEAQYAMLSQKFRVNFVLRGKGDGEVMPLETVSYVGLFRNYKNEPLPKNVSEEDLQGKEQQ